MFATGSLGWTEQGNKRQLPSRGKNVQVNLSFFLFFAGVETEIQRWLVSFDLLRMNSAAIRLELDREQIFPAFSLWWKACSISWQEDHKPEILSLPSFLPFFFDKKFRQYIIRATCIHIYLELATNFLICIEIVKRKLQLSELWITQIKLDPGCNAGQQDP